MGLSSPMSNCIFPVKFCKIRILKLVFIYSKIEDSLLLNILRKLLTDRQTDRMSFVTMIS